MVFNKKNIWPTFQTPKERQHAFLPPEAVGVSARMIGFQNSNDDKHSRKQKKVKETKKKDKKKEQKPEKKHSHHHHHHDDHKHVNVDDKKSKHVDKSTQETLGQTHSNDHNTADSNKTSSDIVRHEDEAIQHRHHTSDADQVRASKFRKRLSAGKSRVLDSLDIDDLPPPPPMSMLIPEDAVMDEFPLPPPESNIQDSEIDIKFHKYKPSRDSGMSSASSSTAASSSSSSSASSGHAYSVPRLQTQTSTREPDSVSMTTDTESLCEEDPLYMNLPWQNRQSTAPVRPPLPVSASLDSRSKTREPDSVSMFTDTESLLEEDLYENLSSFNRQNTMSIIPPLPEPTEMDDSEIADDLPPPPDDLEQTSRRETHSKVPSSQAAPPPPPPPPPQSANTANVQQTQVVKMRHLDHAAQENRTKSTFFHGHTDPIKHGQAARPNILNLLQDIRSVKGIFISSIYLEHLFGFVCFRPKK